MTIDNTLFIAATAALAGTGTFLREQQADAELDTSSPGDNSAAPRRPPYIVLGDYTSARADASSKVESALVSVFFGDVRPGQGDDPLAHQAAVARMEALRQRFMAALDAGPLVQLTGFRATPMANVYSAMLDGVGCQFTMTVPSRALC